MSLTRAARNNPWTANSVAIGTAAQNTAYLQFHNSLVVSLFTHLINWFLTSPLLTGNPHAAPREDAVFLQWLQRKLHEVRETGFESQDLETRAVVVAGTAYAVVVGSLSWGNGPEGLGPSPILTGFQAWAINLLEAWRVSPKPMTESVATQVLERVVWLRSDDGIEIVKEVQALAAGSF